MTECKEQERNRKRQGQRNQFVQNNSFLTYILYNRQPQKINPSVEIFLEAQKKAILLNEKPSKEKY